MYDGLEMILDQLPHEFSPFEGSEYSMPVSQAILADIPEIAKLKDWLGRAAEGDLKHAMEPVAVAAEVIESSAEDRYDYFLNDIRVQRTVFRGAKWRAGWVLLAGDGVSDELADRLNEDSYMVFSSRHPTSRAYALPERETGAVYFLQLMVRYAMTWGTIPPGEDHEMGHFLERDMPGAMVVLGSIGPLEGLLFLALMKLGCPTVVGPDFPYDIGPRAVARSDDEVMEALSSFPNMRVRVLAGEKYALPGEADPAYAKEKFDAKKTIRGLLQLRPSDTGGAIEANGDPSSDSISIIVEVKDDKIDLPISAYLEGRCMKYGSYLPGVRLRRGEERELQVELSDGVELEPKLLGETIAAGIKRNYPRLDAVGVHVAMGGKTLARQRQIAEEFEVERDAAILAESEESVDEFVACIDCQPFSHSHVCIVTPARLPMCGQHHHSIRARALWGADFRPWTRREVGEADLQYTVPKGEPIDRAAGEWTGANEAVKRLSGGKVERVRLHGVCEAPHTSCGCFGALAFKLPGADGIGVMDRRYRGQAPGELTWSILANHAGGKQCPGVTGITLDYLQRPGAFEGEGGLTAVKWATKRAYDVLKPGLPDGAKVATEDDATTLEELHAFQK
ncbi:MAG: hypothetical protein GY906_36140, partial [bacterium]|nr:hypothetical protein [bacterium]